MKRIVPLFLATILITILYAWWNGFTGDYPAEDGLRYWILFFISWIPGMVVSIVAAIMVARILKLDYLAWSSQDLRAAIFGLFFVSYFLGMEIQFLGGRALSNLFFDSTLVGSRSPVVTRIHVSDTFGSIIGWCILGGLLYLMYRVAERSRRRPVIFDLGARERRQKVFLFLKLVGAGVAILLFTLWISTTELNKRVQVGLVDRRWNLEPDSLLQTVTFEHTGLSHRRYLESLVQICSKLKDVGARVVVVPLPIDLKYSPSSAFLVETMARFGNVLFAVSANEKGSEPQFEVDAPLDKKVSVEWGVISTASFSAMFWWRPYKYYPWSYCESSAIPNVGDVAIEVVRKFLNGKQTMQPRVEGRKFSMGQYSTGLLDDGGALIVHRVYPYSAFEFYAIADDSSESVQFAVGGTHSGFQTGSNAKPWDLLAGKIVIVDPGEEITKTMNFGWTYMNIIHNILNGEGSRPLDAWTPLITLMMLTIVGVLIVFVRTWIGLIAVVGLTFCQGYLYFWLGFNRQIAFEPFPPIIGTILALIAFSFVVIADERKQMDRYEKKRALQELKTAHDMQMGLMPTSDPVVRGFDISGICTPADEVGGDYFDYVWLDEKKTKLGIAVADVSGKAMKAAITAVMTSGMVYREAGNNETPKSILTKINRPLYLKTERRIFTAMSFAVIDLQKKSMTFSNAGQMQPLLKRIGKTSSLQVRGAHLPLGMAEDVEYGETTVRLKKGDMLVFYTDGVPEAMNNSNEMFGFERFEAIVKQSSVTLSSKEIAVTIVEKVKEFTGPTKQHDDMTVVVVKVL